jgi:hypothetical protein
MAQAQISTQGERERARAFADLGFNPSQSLVLAATQEAGEHVDLALVRRLLAAGYDHSLAMRIVL